MTPIFPEICPPYFQKYAPHISGNMPPIFPEIFHLRGAYFPATSALRFRAVKGLSGLSGGLPSLFGLGLVFGLV